MIIIQNILNDGFVLILLFSLIPLLICTGLSFLVAMFQALTQIQEQSISYAIKFSSLLAFIWFGGNCFSNYITNYLHEAIKSVALIGQAL